MQYIDHSKSAGANFPFTIALGLNGNTSTRPHPSDKRLLKQRNALDLLCLGQMTKKVRDCDKHTAKAPGAQ